MLNRNSSLKILASFSRLCSVCLLAATPLLTTSTHALASSPTGAPDIISPDSIRAHHQALVDISTQAGSLNAGVRLNEAGNKTAQYLLDGYRNAGLENVRLEPFYPNRWWPADDYAVTLLPSPGHPEQTLTTFPLWNSGKAQGLELELVYAGFGTSGELDGIDVEGKAVLIDMKRLLHFVPSWHNQLTAALQSIRERGALAVIVAETRIPTPSGAFVGSSGAIKNGKAGSPDLYPLPAFSIGMGDAQTLKDRLHAGPTKVRVNLGYSLAQTTAYNIVAELPGNGSIDEYLIVGGHYDTWFTGAIDNLGSQAALLEIARYMSSLPQEKRPRDIKFVSLFGHELGNYFMGQSAFVESLGNTTGKITAFVNIDGSGSWGWEEKGNSGNIFPTDQDDKAAIASTSLALSALAYKAIYKHAPSNWMRFPLNFFVSDMHESISDAGIPGLLLISKHIFYHTPLDTLDRIDPEQVYRRTLINIDIIESLLDSSPGYFIAVDGNPNRVRTDGDAVLPDLTPEQLPAAPENWESRPPSALEMQVIPDSPRVFSPVVFWGGYWKNEGIIDGLTWQLGGISGLLLGPQKTLFGKTLYLFPGKKTISMTVTNSQGKSSTLSREITVVAGKFALLYYAAGLLLAALALVLITKLRRKLAI